MEQGSAWNRRCAAHSYDRDGNGNLSDGIGRILRIVCDLGSMCRAAYDEASREKDKDSIRAILTTRICGGDSVVAGLRRLNGSITVEAVFVVPVIVFIITAFVFFGMYLHDDTLIVCTMNQACERLNQSVKQPTNYESGVIFYDKMTEKGLLDKYTSAYESEVGCMKKYIKNTLEQRLMVSKIASIEVQKKRDRVHLVVTTKSQISWVQVLRYVSGFQKSRYEVEGGIYDPSEYARAVSVSLDAVSDTKAMDAVTKVFSKMEQALR